MSQFLNSPYEGHWDVVICILNISNELQEKVFCMKAKVILEMWHIQMQSGQVLLLIGDPPWNIAFLSMVT